MQSVHDSIFGSNDRADGNFNKPMKETEGLLSLGDASMAMFTSSPFLIHCLTHSIIEGNMASAWAWLCVLMRASMPAVAAAVAAIIFCSMVYLLALLLCRCCSWSST